VRKKRKKKKEKTRRKFVRRSADRTRKAGTPPPVMI